MLVRYGRGRILALATITRILGLVWSRVKVLNKLHSKVSQGQFSFQVSGAGNNKTVPGVPFFFSSGGSPVLFTPFINLSQPTIRSSSLCSRGQLMCRVAHKGVIFVFQDELEIPMLSPLTIQSFWEMYNCVKRCYLIHLCLSQTGTVWQGKLKAAWSEMKEAIPGSSLLGQLLHRGLIHEKCHGCIFSSRWQRELAWVPTMGWCAMFNSSRSPHIWEASHHNSFSTLFPANKWVHWGREAQTLLYMALEILKLIFQQIDLLNLVLLRLLFYNSHSS